MKDTETVTLDEILRAFAKKIAFNAINKQIGSKELYVPHKPLAEAETAILKLFEQVIGEDEHEYENDKGRCMLCAEEDYCRHEIRNDLRYEQRQRLQALSNSGKAGE